MKTADDLFSCIGGHAIGLGSVGFRTIRFAEMRPERRQLIQEKFPGIPVFADVRGCTGIKADILIGGPPCQRTSVAAAIHGNRTGESLFPEMLRIADEGEYEWVIVEQPPGNKAWETEVEGGLAGIGLHSARIEFAACDLGAPHIRRRVFFLAHACLPRLALAWQAIPSEIDRFARAAATGNPWRKAPPRDLRVAHGVSAWLDRNAAIEAIGDSNPPGMAAVLGRAIMRAYEEDF